MKTAAGVVFLFGSDRMDQAHHFLFQATRILQKSMMVLAFIAFQLLSVPAALQRAKAVLKRLHSCLATAGRTLHRHTHTNTLLDQCNHAG